MNISSLRIEPARRSHLRCDSLDEAGICSHSLPQIYRYVTETPPRNTPAAECQSINIVRAVFVAIWGKRHLLKLQARLRSSIVHGKKEFGWIKQISGEVRTSQRCWLKLPEFSGLCMLHQRLVSPTKLVFSAYTSRLNIFSINFFGLAGYFRTNLRLTLLLSKDPRNWEL